MSNVIDTSQVTAPVRSSVTSAPAEPSVQETVPTREANSDQEVKARQENAVAGKEIPPKEKDQALSTEEKMKEAAKEMQKYVKSVERDLKFSVDKDSGRTVITVIDPETDKVVRQIPPEETLHILRNMERGGGSSLFEEIA